MKRLTLLLFALFISTANAAVDANQPSQYKDQIPRLYNNWQALADANLTGGIWTFDQIITNALTVVDANYPSTATVLL